MERNPRVTCTECSTHAWRPDWEFLKEFFRREECSQQEMQTLVSQHTHDYQSLHRQLTALQLTHCSTKAYLEQAEHQRNTLYADNFSLQAQVDELNTQYNDIAGRLARKETAHNVMQEQYQELCQMSQAQESILTYQAAALDEQAAEAEAAHTTATKLGDTMNKLLAADDFASEAFAGAIEIADIMMKNKYQEVTIAKLQKKLDCLTAQTTSGSHCCCGQSTPSSTGWSLDTETSLLTANDDDMGDSVDVVKVDVEESQDGMDDGEEDIIEELSIEA